MVTPVIKPPSPPSPPADVTWEKQSPPTDSQATYSFWTPVNAPILDETFILDETRLK